MIRSSNQELGEYDLIKRPEHLAKVWETVESSLPAYWRKFVDAERAQGVSGRLSAKFGSGAIGSTEPDGIVVGRTFEKAIADYEKEISKYQLLFDADSMDEFHDDPNSFKQALSRDVPVIANTLRNRRAELRDWQVHFRTAGARDLLAVFTNVLDFAGEWLSKHPSGLFSQLADRSEVGAFGLDALDEDKSMSMTNVIGMGIVSIVLYHLDAERLPPRGRFGLYGLYFLSGRQHFNLPSKSSEFLMINDVSRTSDGSMVMDQNYWYPYGLFSLYALRIFNWIEKETKKSGIALNRARRFVYVERFFESVCAQHHEDLKTMRAHERFEVPG